MEEKDECVLCQSCGLTSHHSCVGLSLADFTSSMNDKSISHFDCSSCFMSRHHTVMTSLQGCTAVQRAYSVEMHSALQELTSKIVSRKDMRWQSAAYYSVRSRGTWQKKHSKCKPAAAKSYRQTTGRKHWIITNKILNMKNAQGPQLWVASHWQQLRGQEGKRALGHSNLLTIRNAVSSLSKVPINDLLIKRKYKSKSKLHLSGGLWSVVNKLYHKN